MNDTSYLIIFFLFGVICILINIYRASTRRRLSDEEKKRAKSNQTKLEEKFDDDIVVNPAFSFLKFNIFHKDQKDEDDQNS
jgi:hypothetical protein